MTKPQHASGYEERSTEAVRRVLIDLAHLLGAYRELRLTRFCADGDKPPR